MSPDTRILVTSLAFVAALVALGMFFGWLIWGAA